MTNNKDHSLPSVSVIVPAYNAEKNIGKLIKSLLRQDYPQELLEIIIVDNSSADRTRQIIKRYPVKLLEEKEIQSSYAARNRGVRHAGGRILAFIDSDCEAEAEWIKAGVEALTSGSADLAGGCVEFMYSKRRTASEYLDSVTQMHTASTVNERDVAATANLFVRATLFDDIGLFPDDVKSGGDWQWTGKAVKNGFRLVYAPKAVVRHPARTLIPLLRKGFRVGGGMIPTMIQETKPTRTIIYAVLMLFKPPRLLRVKKLLSEKGSPEMNEKLLRIWLVLYLWSLSKACGALVSAPIMLRRKGKK